MMKNLMLDYEFQFGRRPRKRNFLSAFLFFPGFRAVAILRVQMFAQERGMQRMALLFSNVNQIISGAEICVGAKVGVPLLIRHPSGIVIGGGVTIGKYCTILHGVTLGERYVQNPDGLYPTIGDNVQIGCNASILGNVKVGSRSSVGAHALVLRDIDPGKTVIGVF